ncbi:AAA family ATPase [Actinomyces wuliandei]|uniref:AAA family ATPase n=1 Tax=Actinomyces wuliandei TaxID=2057743 RepID=UPI000FD71C7F|nr:ATP-binding protein [Actinomyces wuliandei]
MLLAFSVANYRTFRDEVTLDLTRRSLRTLTPRDGETWEGLTWRVAAVYGANASGKSTLLDALQSFSAAVGGHRDILHQPYLLDEQHPVAPTTYTLDFTRGSQRYRYFVEAHGWGIAHEELWEAERRWKRLFLRTQDRDDPEPTVVPGPSLRGATAEVRRITTSKDLFLALALRYRHASLAPVARSLRSIRPIQHTDIERDARLSWLTEHLAEETAGATQWHDVVDAVAHSADLGILRVELEERDIPHELLARIRLLFTSDDEEPPEIPDELLRQLQHSLVFVHRGTDGKEYRLPLEAQSQGTLTWLATMGPAADALSHGHLLLVDELDASLHPTAVASLVELFKDTDLNRHGAQLVFTTHDASLLGNSPTQPLERGEVWLCEKDDDGSADLYSVADFTGPRQGTNKERQYLAGAFGAVPRVDTSSLRHALTAPSLYREVEG